MKIRTWLGLSYSHAERLYFIIIFLYVFIFMFDAFYIWLSIISQQPCMVEDVVLIVVYNGLEKFLSYTNKSLTNHVQYIEKTQLFFFTKLINSCKIVIFLYFYEIFYIFCIFLYIFVYFYIFFYIFVYFYIFCMIYIFCIFLYNYRFQITTIFFFLLILIILEKAW